MKVRAILSNCLKLGFTRFGRANRQERFRPDHHRWPGSGKRAGCSFREASVSEKTRGTTLELSKNGKIVERAFLLV
jgi:hypothetical protein